ncbi:hypothetical protein F8C76_02450 [Flagellimonas olearia]|uniref:Aldolase n=1 Tax=Flagellimonas olearia TaxID=552546 RepID=A0A6I1DZU9_9FLAO|nr:hypothetical protein [Allomuricauda olearia]KAB7530387.1 hypothetical protein F8C76_02450 [Allomuricauda olearia]
MKIKSNNDLMRNYRTLHQQGFLPIFVSSDNDNRRLVHLLVEAGYKAMEYTLRCEDAAEMIPWIRRTYPDMVLLIGSTMDGDKVLSRLRQRNDDGFLSLDDLADMGSHGFVSMHRFTESTFEKFASSHLLLPAVYTPNEAIDQFEMGAHFVKLLGPDLTLLKQCTSRPTFGYCPTMVTGGMNLERIPQAIESGATIIGGGFDLLFGQSNIDEIPDDKIISLLTSYRREVQSSVKKKFPELDRNANKSNHEWFEALSHQHPFFDFK